MDKRPKNPLISFLQVYAIILVVASHSGLGLPYYDYHLALFMMVSGFLQRYNREDYRQLNIWKAYRSKFERLMVPYIVLTTLAWLPKALLNSYAARPMEISFEYYLKGLAYPAYNPVMPYWFLPTLFTIFIIVLPLLKYFNNRVVLLGLLLISIIVTSFKVDVPAFFGFANSMTYLKWWVAGFYFAIYGDRVIKLLRLGSWYSTLIFLVGTLAAGYIPGEISVRSIIAPIPGILLSVSLGIIYIRHKWTVLNHLYGYSFPIYLLHWFPQVLIMVVFKQIYPIPIALFWFFSLAAGVYLPWLIAKTVKKYWGDKYLVRIIFGL